MALGDNLTSIIGLTKTSTELLARVLPLADTRSLAAEAREIITKAPESTTRVRNLFQETKQRLGRAWTIGVIMTVTLFCLVVALVVAAVVSGLVLNKPTYSIVFGGLSASSLFTVVMWKPYDMMFKVTITAQQLEMILVGLEQVWSAAARLPDSERLAKISAANQAALEQMARLPI